MGAGKNILARAILGFWPWGSGYLSLPAGYDTAIAHASPYLPEGSLEDAIQCPAPRGAFQSQEIASALSACGLSHLVNRLDQKARWMQTLSASEKQRCAIARLLLHKPGVIVLEDALSACDAAVQADLTRLVFDRCESSVIIDISNRPAPAHLYDRTFILTRSGDQPSKLEEGTRMGGAARRGRSVKL
jgi:putative ATP-binding cassette transporter